MGKKREKRKRVNEREERAGGRREEEMSWWKDAGDADTCWEVEDSDRLRRSYGKADGRTRIREERKYKIGE